MTRKDYELIAKVISTAWYSSRNDKESVATGLADAFELDSPRFDRERFLIAAGVYEKCEKCAKRARFFTSGTAYCSLPHAPAWAKRVAAQA